MTATAVSLFAGVGGFDLAAVNVGINVVAAVEIDANARGVLAHKFPETTLFDDVRKVTADDLLAAGFIPRGGFIFGGFPCQDLSVAGKRAGLDGERSGLFFEIVRLLTELQPTWFVLENVPGLLSSNGGKDMGTVIGALADIGYGIAYRVLDAQYFGVPQRRRRVFIVGHFGDDGRTPAQILAIGESSRRDPAPRKPQRQNPAGTTTDSTGDGRSGGVLGSDKVGALCASDHKFPQQQQVMENKVIVGTLSPGAHPGGFNGQDAYSGQLVVGEVTSGSE